MKQSHLYFLSIIMFFCFSCSNSAVETKTENTRENCVPYFTFDSIEHYHVEVDSNGVSAIERKKKLSDIEQEQINMMYEDSSKTLADTIIYQNLEHRNFVKASIPNIKFDTINKIFCNRNLDEYESAACIPIYRDILIFKNKNKTVGVAKICFKCGMSLIIGASERTTMLYTHDDYVKLKKILYSK